MPTWTLMLLMSAVVSPDAPADPRSLTTVPGFQSAADGANAAKAAETDPIVSPPYDRRIIAWCLPGPTIGR